MCGYGRLCRCTSQPTMLALIGATMPTDILNTGEKPGRIQIIKPTPSFPPLPGARQRCGPCVLRRRFLHHRGGLINARSIAFRGLCDP